MAATDSRESRPRNDTKESLGTAQARQTCREPVTLRGHRSGDRTEAEPRVGPVCDDKMTEVELDKPVEVV